MGKLSMIKIAKKCPAEDNSILYVILHAFKLNIITYLLIQENLNQIAAQLNLNTFKYFKLLNKDNQMIIFFLYNKNDIIKLVII